MIRLEHPRTVAGVPVDFTGAGRVAGERALIELFRDGKEPSSSRWKKAKDHLKAESFGKCAYCEAPTDTVAHGDVEHFRPKSVYWWLAYCFDNYTFACQICNQVHKKTKFPISGRALVAPVLPTPLGDVAALAGSLAPDPLDTGALAAHQALAAREKAHLPDPYLTDPETLFAWKADDILREVRIRPRTRQVASVRAYAAALDVLGLDREELRRLRYGYYEAASVLRDISRSPGLPSAATDIASAQLGRMMHARSPFAGMVRYFVRTKWALGIPVPD